jgi:hypothetical protein
VRIAETLNFHNCREPVDLSKVPKNQFVVAPYLILPKTDGITIQFESLKNVPAYILWGTFDFIRGKFGKVI